MTTMTDKSYVTMCVCPICHKETGELLLDQRLRPKFDRLTVTPRPCDECKKKYLGDGVMLLDPKTGALAVIKVSAFRRIFNTPVPDEHIAFVETGVLEKIGALK